MARWTLEQINEKLTAATAAGQIWNVEITDIKFVLGNLIWRDKNLEAARHAVEEVFRPMRDQLKVYEAASYLMISNGHEILNAVNAINRATAKAGNAQDPAIVAFFETAKGYIQAAEMVRDLKDKVIKGRKPAENPNLNIRTIENTGTCGCCGRNIKLSAAGRIVDHGYGIYNRGYGFGAGYKAGASCFGFHYEPIEVSPKVWEDMKAAMEARLAKLPEILAGAKANFASMAPAHRLNPLCPVLTKDQKDHNRSRQLAERAILDMTHELERLPYNIEGMTDKLAAWTPMPLPGTRSTK